MFTVASVFTSAALSPDLASLCQCISQQYSVDEDAYAAELIEQVPIYSGDLQIKAYRLVSQVRQIAAQ